MTILTILLSILTVFCNTCFATNEKERVSQSLTLDKAISKLEQDIEAKKDSSIIADDVKTILNLKSKLPVKHIPEVNYLLDREIDPLPETNLALLKKVLSIVLSTINGIETLLFIFSFYVIILFFQSLKLKSIYKLAITFMAILIQFIIPFINIDLILAIFGVTLVLLFKLKKIKYLLISILSVSLLILLQSTVNMITNLSLNSRFLYEIKIERDGYVPEFLIKEVFKGKKEFLLEEVTNDLALGKLNSINKIKGLKFNNPELNQIYYNNLGYVAFQKGDYVSSLNYFKKALSYNSKNEFVLYNLYLANSALFKLNKVNNLEKELLSKKTDILNYTSTPTLIHVPANYKFFSFPIPVLNLVYLFTGLFLGFIIILVLPLQWGYTNFNIIPLIGMNSFLEERVLPFLTIPILVALVNFIFGMEFCQS